MANIMIHHKVQDFETWKKAFDEHASARDAAGCTGGELFQGADDPNEVVIRFSWDTVENARAFSSSDNLREVMAKAGVLGQPTIVFLGGADPVKR